LPRKHLGISFIVCMAVGSWLRWLEVVEIT
jgi:hypothetical protein